MEEYRTLEGDDQERQTRSIKVAALGCALDMQHLYMGEGSKAAEYSQFLHIEYMALPLVSHQS